MLLSNVNGPVRYEKVVLRLYDIPHVIHFFSDDHVRVTKCDDDKEKSIDLQTLVVNTLNVYPSTDIVYEGSDRQKSMVGNYLREFRNAFPMSCWEHHICDQFPHTIFHSVDIRSVIYSNWMKEIFLLKMYFSTDDVHLMLPHVTAKLIIDLKGHGPVSQQILKLWMYSLIMVSGRLATRYEELAEDWVKWICKGRPMDASIEKIFISKSIIPISYDKYILDHIGSVGIMYKNNIDKWLQDAYHNVTVNPIGNVTLLLAFMVDLAAILVLLSSHNPYSIVYMGHQHTHKVLEYLKELSNEYSTFQSLPTPNNNPVQCLRIPLLGGILPMNLDVYDTLIHEEPAWKYYGKNRKSRKNRKSKHKRKTTRST